MWRRALLTGCLLLAASCSGSRDGAGSPQGASSRDELIERLLAAVDQRSLDGLLPLYCWDGVDEPMKEWVTEKMVRRLIYMQALSAHYVPLAEGESQPTATIKGKEYGPSLEVTGHIVIRLDGGFSASVPVGKKDERHFIAVVAARRLLKK